LRRVASRAERGSFEQEQQGAIARRARKGHAVAAGTRSVWTEGIRIFMHLHHAQGFLERPSTPAGTFLDAQAVGHILRPTEMRENA